jgi:predicted ribosomally synthesized peptide with nif11-like leader
VLLTGFGEWSIKIGHKRFQAMSEEQLSAFFEAVKADAALEEKLKGSADVDGAVAIALEAGFDVSKADWLKTQASQILEMSDEELAGVSGGWTALAEGAAHADGAALAEWYQWLYKGNALG